MWGETQDGVITQLRRAAVVAVDDGGTQQLLDLSGLKYDLPRKIVRLQEHGFSSNPPVDGEGLFLALGGRSDRALFLGGAHQTYRPTGLTSGQAVLYDDKGNVVFAQGSSGILVRSNEGDIVVRPVQSNKKIYLGGDPATDTFSPVLTVAGPSSNVMAKIG